MIFCGGDCHEGTKPLRNTKGFAAEKREKGDCAEMIIFFAGEGCRECKNLGFMVGDFDGVVLVRLVLVRVVLVRLVLVRVVLVRVVLVRLVLVRVVLVRVSTNQSLLKKLTLKS